MQYPRTIHQLTTRPHVQFGFSQKKGTARLATKGFIEQYFDF